MEYLWMKDVQAPEFKELNGDKTTDVLIIGGGMAGILCALKLHQAGIDYCLVEGKKIGLGITKATTAVITAQHDTLYSDMISSFGSEKAKMYLDANLDAVKQYSKYCEKVSCDFQQRDSIMYSLTDKELMQQEASAVSSLGFDVEFSTKTPLPIEVKGAVRYPGMAQFHPLKFLYGVAQGLNIYENTFVTKLDDTTAYTNKGVINAKKVIVATHYPFINSHGMYFTKLYQRRSYVIALENAPDFNCTIEDQSKKGVFIRNYNNLLLVGGGGHRTGRKGEGFDTPRDFAIKYFPYAKEKYCWANQDCVSLDGVPYIGPYSKMLPNVLVASGFNLWGMTSSMVASSILTDMVLGKENRFAPVFATDRSVLKPQLFANIRVTMLDFLTPTVKRCSHLGCALKYNKQEHSWDCPCHGSRFDSHGHIIDGPAMRDCHVE